MDNIFLYILWVKCSFTDAQTVTEEVTNGYRGYRFLHIKHLFLWLSDTSSWTSRSSFPFIFVFVGASSNVMARSSGFS